MKLINKINTCKNEERVISVLTEGEWK